MMYFHILLATAVKHQLVQSWRPTTLGRASSVLLFHVHRLLAKLATHITVPELLLKWERFNLKVCSLDYITATVSHTHSLTHSFHCTVVTQSSSLSPSWQNINATFSTSL